MPPLEDKLSELRAEAERHREGADRLRRYLSHDIHWKMMGTSARLWGWGALDPREKAPVGTRCYISPGDCDRIVDAAVGKLREMIAQRLEPDPEEPNGSAPIVSPGGERDHLVDLALRLADEAEAGRRRSCWKGNFDGCDNAGCVHARDLITEARSYGRVPEQCLCREPDPGASTHSYTCRDANGHNDDCPSFCTGYRHRPAENGSDAPSVDSAFEVQPTSDVQDAPTTEQDRNEENRADG